jgi:hypothetical protein
MATHPSNQFPTRTVVLDEAQSYIGEIFAIQVLVAEDATMVVQGKGLFEYVDIDSESAANVVKWINPDTGQPFPAVVDGSAGDLANGKAAGYYQRIDGVDVTLPCIANSIVYGEFSKVTATASDRFLLHIK